MTAGELFQAALERHRAGDNPSAAQSLRQSLQLDPKHFDSNYLLGLIELQANRAAEAVYFLGQAATIRPQSPDVQNNLGTGLRALRRFDEAEAAFRNAIQIRNDYVLAHLNLGTVLRAKGQLAEAVNIYRTALSLKRDFFEAHMNLGNVLKEAGDLGGAADSFRAAVRLRPASAEAQCGLGNVLQTQGEIDAAIACYRLALKNQPAHCNSLTNLGIALKRQGQLDAAVNALEKAVAAQPKSPDAHEHLAGALWDCCRVEEALAHYRTALEIQPTPRLRILFATLVPPIYSSTADVAFWRDRLVAEVDKLKQEDVRQDITNHAPRTLFYLPYQGLDDRDIQSSVASLFLAPADSASGSTVSGKIRVGFISALFKDHTIGLWMQGLIAELSRQDFEVFVLSAGAHHDATNGFIREHCDQYVELPPTLPAARRAIAELNLDILFYTDLGMEPFTNALAFSRLAPVQCVTWGHPLTSGIPTMDYFISAEAAEPANAERHYTEKLVKLANMPLYYYRPKPPTVARGRAHFGLPDEAHIYGCLHSTFKIHAEFDAAIAGILRADPAGLFILPEGTLPKWDEVLKRRLREVMPDVVERIRFLPRLDRDEFRSLTALCDVTLAPFPFGAGDTSLEAFALGVPVVTLVTNQLKGRFTYAMYLEMVIEDCVAEGVAEYITIAVRLGTDSAFSQLIRGKIVERNAVLFENPAGVRDLERFFKSLK